MENLIECKNIAKIYRGRGIGGASGASGGGRSLPFNRAGSSYGLVGESGCGKTSFARSILYLDPPSSGSVLFDGTDLGALSRRELRDSANECR
jgi:ABC-type oligopeptide transport system ATPase subunit